MSSTQSLKIKNSTATELSISQDPKKSSASVLASKTKISEKSSVKVTSKKNVAENLINEVKPKGHVKEKSGKGKQTVVQAVAPKPPKQKEKLVQNRLNTAEAEKKQIVKSETKMKKVKRPTSAPKPVKSTASKVKRTTSEYTPGKGKLTAKSVTGYTKMTDINQPKRPTTAMAKIEVLTSVYKDMQNKSKSLTKIGTSSSKQIKKLPLPVNRPNSAIKRVSAPTTTANPFRPTSQVVKTVKGKATKQKEASSLKTVPPKLPKVVSKTKGSGKVGISGLKFSPGNLSVSIKLKEPGTVGASTTFVGTGIPIGEKLMQDTESQTDVENHEPEKAPDSSIKKLEDITTMEDLPA